MSSCDVESVLRVCLVRPGARLPARASAGAAGYDLASAVDAVIPAGGQLLIALGIKINIPTGHYGRIAPRSGLSVKNRIHVGAGVVDSDYRGEVAVLLINGGHEDFAVTAGDRVAQLILEKCSTLPVVQVEDIGDSTRGEAGFGSTGVTSSGSR